MAAKTNAKRFSPEPEKSTSQNMWPERATTDEISEGILNSFKTQGKKNKKTDEVIRAKGKTQKDESLSEPESKEAAPEEPSAEQEVHVEESASSAVPHAEEREPDPMIEELQDQLRRSQEKIDSMIREMEEMQESQKPKIKSIENKSRLPRREINEAAEKKARNNPKATIIVRERIIEKRSPIKAYELVNQETGEIYPLNGNSTIGALDTCDIVISRKYISKEHAAITREGDSYYIEDTHSRNGTFCNGRKLEEGEQFLLENGDTITLANLDILFREA